MTEHCIYSTYMNDAQVVLLVCAIMLKVTWVKWVQRELLQEKCMIQVFHITHEIEFKVTCQMHVLWCICFMFDFKTYVNTERSSVTIISLQHKDSFNK